MVEVCFDYKCRDCNKMIIHFSIREFSCYANGCNATFQTLLDFEMHYNSNHRYVCAECKKSLPNPRLLDIHVQETHDSFFQVLCTRQPVVFINLMFILYFMYKNIR